MKGQAIALARELGVVGLMNVQFAIQGQTLYVLEVNPRASRTVPFVSKVTGVPLAKLAALCTVGRSLEELGYTRIPDVRHVAVKESVFPFARFASADVVLGPEMKSTGEVMGIARDFPTAFAKSQLAAGVKLPPSGRILLSTQAQDAPVIALLAGRLRALGFHLMATPEAHGALLGLGVTTEVVDSFLAGTSAGPEQLRSGALALIIETARDLPLRREALMNGVPCYTNLRAVRMFVPALEAMTKGDLSVMPLQEYLHGGGLDSEPRSNRAPLREPARAARSVVETPP